MKKKSKREQENTRKLNKSEEKRKEEFERVKEKMLLEGYTYHDLTIDIFYANIMVLVFGVPWIVLFGYFFLHYHNDFSKGMGLKGMLLLIICYIISIVVHEAVHGITWGIFAKGHRESIAFGYIPEYMTPYCTCREPLRKSVYITGALMPTLVLGILPSVIAVYTGSVLLFLLGALMIIGGGGDMTIVYKILMHHSSAKEVIFLDHPYECGVVTFER